ncbi:MAG: 2-oxoacid:acceptor oxidoreductase family protein [Methanomassiliicoccaceae archaeon]|jgi:2-oxoglutarate ferredoxin oxidoreductase subunit gamma|nr:2-oxoacid:acceptor oxidoreductase family protein [Methanomassiliicoccaceae archaeon]
MNMNLLLAGFGGQGILFTGKVVAYSGMLDGDEVSWLPSYGPEMRGGTANCSVCVSDSPIGSPLVTAPDVLIAMNLPSLQKFENAVVPGGLIIVDSSIVDEKVKRKDIRTIYLPATRLAADNGLKGMANMVMTGRLYKETKFCSEEKFIEGVTKSIPAKKADLLEKNMAAIKIGMESGE